MFCPPRNRNKEIDQSIYFFNNLETDIIDKDFQSNLRKYEWFQITKLKNNENYIIKKADKRGAVTICLKGTNNKLFMTI